MQVITVSYGIVYSRVAVYRRCSVQSGMTCIVNPSEYLDLDMNVMFNVTVWNSVGRQQREFSLRRKGELPTSGGLHSFHFEELRA